MEKITSSEMSTERIEKKEYLTFAHSIRDDVVNTFPFESEDQMKIFVDAMNSVIENIHDSYNTDSFISSINNVLGLLKNSHTRLRKKIQSEVSENSISEDKIKELVNSHMIDNNIGYLQINGWSNYKNQDGKNMGDLIEMELENLGEAKHLIIDVRNNTGGNSHYAQGLASHFITEPTHYMDVQRRGDSAFELASKEAMIYPKGKFIDKKIVLLTGHKCFSSNELFILMLKDTGKAITIGQRTGGGSGNPKSFNLKFHDDDYVLDVSTWRVKRLNGEYLEGVGIEPDIEVGTVDGDTDAVFDVAVEYVRQNM